MSGPERNSYFCFPESPKHQDWRENKTNWFPEGPDIKCFFNISIDFFVPVFLFALLCSFFRLKELSQVKNGLTTS